MRSLSLSQSPENRTRQPKVDAAARLEARRACSRKTKEEFVISKRIALAGAMVLSGLFAGEPPASAEKPEARAAEKRRIEAQIAKLEERIEKARVDPGLTEAQLELTRRHAELARKLLNLNNTRASKAVADLAERLLLTEEKKGANP